MSSIDSHSIGKDELQKRLMEITKQIKYLAEEQETIVLQLQENYGSKKQCINNNSKLEVQLSTNSQAFVNIQDIKQEEIVNIQDIKQEEIETVLEENSYLKKRETFTNLETLKIYFEEQWNPDFFQYEVVDPDGDLTERQKLAYIKMGHFVSGYYIDYYDEQIKKAQFKQSDYDLPPDQFKDVAENLFKALTIRSQVLELYENCGKEARVLLYEPAKGVSHLQVYNNGTYSLLDVVDDLIEDRQDFEWNYQKIKAVYELWQAGVVCGSYIDDKREEDFNILYNKLLGFLNIKKEQFNEEQTAILQQILEAGK